MICTNLESRSVVVLTLFLFFANPLYSQNLFFENIKTLNLNYQSIIKKDGEVKGYFFIHEKDTTDNYIDTYKFTIVDTDLSIKSEKDIMVSEETSVFQSSCNGSEIVILFFHADAKTLEYQIYDLNGILKLGYTINVSGKEFRQYKKIALDGADNIKFKGIDHIDSSGFISNTLYLDKNVSSISINFYSTKKNHQWSYVPKNGGSYFFGEYLGTAKNIIYLHLVSFKGSIYTDLPEVFIIGIDLKTGKELFKRSANSKFKILAKGLKILEDGEAYLYGAYYDKGADINKDKALGFALWKMYENGDINEEKYISWQKDFKDYLEVSKNGKISGIGYIYFQNIVQHSNNEFYILGEGHQKVFNSLGLISSLLNGVLLANGLIFGLNGDFIKEVTTDIIIIKLDSNYKIKDVVVYEKKNSNLSDYNGTEMNKSDSSISFLYLSNKTFALNSIKVNNEGITTEKIKANPSATKSKVFFTSNQQKLILNYFKSSKRMEVGFQKI